jgi:ADP-ribosylglycohydrolase
LAVAAEGIACRRVCRMSLVGAATDLPPDYRERVYAGWLGKCIGVRLGAPVETWTYDEIARHLGEVTDFAPLPAGKVFKPDDDTAYPLIMIRALEDFGPEASAEQMGETILNYLGDGRGTIWWGGDGMSTEHTAYLNLTHGIPAPQSGSIARNGRTLAEQCGGQIFSDIWGLVVPNNPELAADYAARASSVTHDGEAVHGGRFIAAAVSEAFSTADPVALVETGLRVIPAGSEYARTVREVLALCYAHREDWRAGYRLVMRDFGNQRYPGPWHVIPNAAVVVMALCNGRGDFARTVRIAASAGWDTDCNAGNAGAIMGVAVGLQGVDEHWRAAMNDVLVAASLTGARNLWSIPACADLLVSLGTRIAGQAHGADLPRCHFDYPGSTHGFYASTSSSHGSVQEARGAEVIDLRQVAPSALRVTLRGLGKKSEARVMVSTYLRPVALSANYYGASFSPQIYPGQTLAARVYTPPDAPQGVLAALYVWDDNQRVTHQSAGSELVPGTWGSLAYDIPRLEDVLLSQAGIVVRNLGETWNGHLLIDSFDWSGAPDFSCDFSRERPEYGAISQWTFLRGYWRLEDGAYHGSGGAVSESYTGDPAWRDLALEVDLVPLAGESHNVNIRVQGARRSYAAGLARGDRIVICKNARGYLPVAEAGFPWQLGVRYHLRVDAAGPTIRLAVDDRPLLTWTDQDEPYLNGQIGFSNFASHTRYERLRVFPPDAVPAAAATRT